MRCSNRTLRLGLALALGLACAHAGADAYEATGVIEVQALKHDGTPLADRFVRIRSRGGVRPSYRQDLLLDDKGYLRVRALKPGRYTVTLLDATGTKPAVLKHSAHGYTSASERVEVLTGQTHSVRFRIPQGGQIEILVPDVSLEPKALRYSFGLREWRDDVAAWVPLPSVPAVKYVTTRRKLGRGRDGHVFLMVDVPPGRYSLSTYRAGYRRLFNHDFPVLAGIATQMGIARFHKGLSLTLAYRGPFLKSAYAGKEPVQVSYWGPRRKRCWDVQHGTFDPKTPEVKIGGLSTGNYAVLLRAHGYVTFVDVPVRPAGVIELKPPAFLHAAPQGHAIGVQAQRKGKGFGRMFCVLLPHDPQAQRGPRPGRWGWFADLGGKRTFTGVADGTYEVLVFDGVYGTACAFQPNPHSTLVRVNGKDTVVTVQLDEPKPKAATTK